MQNMPDHTRLTLKSQIRIHWKAFMTWWGDMRYGKGPKNVPKRLKRSSLQALEADVALLRSYGVDVHELALGEEPTAPKPAGKGPPGY